MSLLDRFREVWFVDFEFRVTDGGLPEPICMVAKEMQTRRTVSVWKDQFAELQRPPFDIGNLSLFVAFFASAEFSCFLALKWPLPVNVLDLYAEFRNHTNGLYTPNGNGLLGALSWFGLDSISAIEKDANRELVLRGNYTAEDTARIMDYCKRDVDCLERLFHTMREDLQPQALLRGRYMKSVAIMERNGIPVDVPLFSRLRSQWEALKAALIAEVDKDFGVFEGQTFKREKFAKWLSRQGILWLALESGQLALDDDTFKDMARTHPELEPLRQLRWTLSQMRLTEIAIGPDGRNRCLLSPFRAKTGRNQPSNARFIFGPAVWLRGFIKPPEGYAVAYVDWEQQEFGIAAALSRDPNMIEAYLSGDPYLKFAKMAKAIPEDATKETHPKARELFKSTALAVQYCMGPDSLALRLGVTRLEARTLLDLHRSVFRKFWRWSDSAVDYALLNNRIHTAFGWQYRVVDKTNDRSLRNFPMQANGAEMLRIACCLATERGIKVCAPIHDALLIEAPISDVQGVVEAVQSAMREAAEATLNGFPLRTEAKVFQYPDRYMDERGERMWNMIMKLLDETNATPVKDDTKPLSRVSPPLNLI